VSHAYPTNKTIRRYSYKKVTKHVSPVRAETAVQRDGSIDEHDEVQWLATSSSEWRSGRGGSGRGY